MGLEAWVIQALITVASIAYQQEQARKMKAKMAADADKRKGQQFATRGEVRHIPVAYGKNKIGGHTVGYRVTNSFNSGSSNADKVMSKGLGSSGSGSKKEFLSTQEVICQEGIESVEHIIVNGTSYLGSDKEREKNAAKFTHRFHIHYNGGTADPAGANVGFNANNKFTGCTWSHNTFKLNRDEPQYSGAPQIQYIIKGMKVRKITESGGTYTLNSTYEYTNNPAYCLLDYLMSSKYGRGLTVDQVDLESFYKGASICDMVVGTNKWSAGSINGQKPIASYSTVSAFPPWPEQLTNWLYYAEDTAQLYKFNITNLEEETGSYSPIDSPTESDYRLYECNLTIDTKETIRSNIERILDTMGMAELVWTPQGAYKLILDYPTSAAEQDALIVDTFTEDDIIRESVQMGFPRAEDRFTQAKVSFLNEFEEFKEDSAVWPPTLGTIYNQYLGEDNNKPNIVELKADGVTDPYHAKAIAEQQVRKSRTMYTLTFTVSKKGLVLEPGDLIKVTIASMGISNEVFRIESTQINSDFTVKLVAYLFDYQILSWNIDDNIPYTVKPRVDFTVEQPYNVAFTADGEEVLGTASGKVTWDIAEDVGIQGYIVEISTDGNTWNELGRTSRQSFDITGLKTGVYTFGVRAYTITGQVSERVVSGGETIQLKTVSKVLVVYADTADAATNTQSTTAGSNEYVAYYVFDGDEPTLPIRTGIEFTKFVGYTPVKGVDYFDGTSGTSGTSVAQLTIYKRSATAITTTPTGGSFVFDTGTATAPAGWYTSIPSGTDTIYACTGFASVVGTTGTDSDITWSTPYAAMDVGADGATGKSTFLASIFKRDTSAPTAPTGGTFNFESNTLTPPTGWSVSIPTGTDPLYQATYLFSIAGDEGTATATTWATPVEISRDGSNGSNGVSTYQISIFRRSATTLTTPPTGGSYNFTDQTLTVPTDWYASPPTGTDPVYVSTALASVEGNTGTDSSLGWTNPTLLVQNGTDGAPGAPGAAGARGAGWWRYETGTTDSTEGLNDTTLNAYFSTATGLTPTAADRFIVVNTSDQATAYLRNSTNTAWQAQTAFIDGSLLVANTVTASAINVSNLGDVNPNAGTITAGVLRNNDSTFVIDLTNGTITISV